MIVLTTIGVGNLKVATYAWNDRQFRTDFFPEALAAWFPEATIIVLATDEAAVARTAKLEALGSRCHLVSIPVGKSQDEFWAIFNAVTQALPEGEQVVLDITHGFRSLTLLTFLSLGFLRFAKEIELKHVLYGAFEASTDDVKPVFDLTPFVTMLDWANATNRFLETGDARKLTPLLEVNEASALKNAGTELKKFTEAVMLHRTVEATETAERLVKRLEEAKNSSRTPQQQPFSLLEERLEQGVRSIANKDEIVSHFAQVAWYVKHDQFAQAISLAREWMVTVRIMHTDGRFSVSRLERELAEGWLTSFAKILETKTEAERDVDFAQKLEDRDPTLLEKKIAEDEDVRKDARQQRPKKIPPAWLEFIKLWGKLSDQRNDYAHFGMRPSKISSSTTLKKAKRLLDELRDAVKPLGLELPDLEP